MFQGPPGRADPLLDSRRMMVLDQAPAKQGRTRAGSENGVFLGHSQSIRRRSGGAARAGSRRLPHRVAEGLVTEGVSSIAVTELIGIRFADQRLCPEEDGIFAGAHQQTICGARGPRPWQRPTRCWRAQACPTPAKVFDRPTAKRAPSSVQRADPAIAAGATADADSVSDRPTRQCRQFGIGDAGGECTLRAPSRRSSRMPGSMRSTKS